MNLQRNIPGSFSRQDMGIITDTVMMTPAVGKDDYWLYRVQLSLDQAIIGFPKFSTIGIGFIKEEDWNTNLPFDCDATAIFNHVKPNKGDPRIRDDDCVKAIEMIQDAIKQDYEIEYREFGTRVVADLKGLKKEKT